MNVNEYSGRTLAFLGDAAWSLAVRDFLLRSGVTRGDELQKKAIAFVRAEAQCRFYEALHEEGFLSEWEEEIFHRGRNSHGGRIPKSTTPQVYRISTGFEAVLGALYLENRWDRIEEIWDRIRVMEEEAYGTMDVREERSEADTE